MRPPTTSVWFSKLETCSLNGDFSLPCLIPKGPKGKPMFFPVVNKENNTKSLQSDIKDMFMAFHAFSTMNNHGDGKEGSSYLSFFCWINLNLHRMVRIPSNSVRIEVEEGLVWNIRIFSKLGTPQISNISHAYKEFPWFRWLNPIIQNWQGQPAGNPHIFWVYKAMTCTHMSFTLW